MRFSSRNKHLLHCASFMTIILIFQHYGGGIKFFWNNDNHKLEIDPINKYGQLFTWFLYGFRLVALLSMLSMVPILISTILGLILYNAFPDKVDLKVSPSQSPFICFRTVTRGDYPELVKRNVNRNMDTCLSVGLENFVIEVVTGKRIGVNENRHVRELVVPEDYRTKTGALFRGRKLQYCLDNNTLNDDDWIVHLDEETILTEDSVCGIINFVSDGRHPIGQGAIIFNEDVVNWLTAFGDCFQSSLLMSGLFRFPMKMFHRPLFGVKGSFMVCKSSVERDVSFDHGPKGSIGEDIYFAMNADMKGYSYDFIDGPMLEQSPMTVSEFLQQRKRYIQSYWMIVSSPQIELTSKFFYVLTFFHWITLPSSPIDFILTFFFPLPSNLFYNVLSNVFFSTFIYLYVFGFVKAFSLERLGYRQYFFNLIRGVSAIPFIFVIENLAVLMGILDKKNDYVVVKKKQ